MLEVERKFLPSAAHLIARNAASPAFRNFKTLPTYTFTDIYYDQADKLRSAGIWVRKRDQKWEAKIKLGGDYIHSQFCEIDTPGKIATMLKQHIPMTSNMIDLTDLSTPTELQPFGLTTFASFTTTRQTWTASVDDKTDVSIVIDTTDFGHQVGEVELQVPFAEEDVSTTATTATTQSEAIQSMQATLDAFMADHRMAFPQAECKGKLSAYFNWKRNARQSGGDATDA